MVATLVLLLFHVKVTPLMVLPELSLAVAVNCWVAPTAMEGDDGETVMLEMVSLEPEEVLEEPPQAERIQATAKSRSEMERLRRSGAARELGIMGASGVSEIR